MTNVIDFATRQPVAAEALRMSGAELARYARAHEGPDFEKRRGKMVITPETQAEVDRLFEVFALGIRSDADPVLQLNTWSWLGAKVAEALEWHDESPDFYFPTLILKHRHPEFVRYVLALIEGDKATASEAAKMLGVYDGLRDDHSEARFLQI